MLQFSFNQIIMFTNSITIGWKLISNIEWFSGIPTLAFTEERSEVSIENCNWTHHGESILFGPTISKTINFLTLSTQWYFFQLVQRTPSSWNCWFKNYAILNSLSAEPKPFSRKYSSEKSLRENSRKICASRFFAQDNFFELSLPKLVKVQSLHTIRCKNFYLNRLNHKRFIIDDETTCLPFNR